MSSNPLRERRKRATRWFGMRVFLMVVLIGVIAYSAWFAAKPVRHIPVEITHPMQSEVEAQTPQRPDRRVYGLLALIVVLGLALRLWGIGWSLPDARHPLATYHPDELIDLGAAQNIDLGHGKFDVGFYSYGAFYFYLVSLADTIGHGYGAIPITPPWPSNRPWLSDTERLVRVAPERAGEFLAGRIVTALMGTGTIVVIFALGSRLYRKRVGLAAALLYAILPLAVVHAHFLTVDVPATLFVALALLWSARLLTVATWREYVLAGVWCGLAAATKYNTVLVIVAPIVAHLRSAAPGAVRTQRGIPLLALFGVALLTFLLACPGPLLNWDVFWNGSYPGSGVRYELFEHSRTGHGDLFVDTGPGWWYHLVISLRYGLGLPLLAAVLFGLGVGFRRRTPQDWVLLAFFLLFYLTTGLSAVRFARYMIPLFPVFCVLAARAFTEMGTLKIDRRALPAVLAVIVLLTAGYTVSLVHAMTVTDPRDAAASMLEKSAPQGASVAFAKTPWYFSPPLSPWFGAPSAPLRVRGAQMTRFQLRIPEGEWNTAVLTPPPDYIVLSNIETMQPLRLHEAPALAFLQAIPPDYHKEEFPAPPIFDMAFGGALVPDDLLYILPHLTVYKR